jgi:hypothetical protein
MPPPRFFTLPHAKRGQAEIELFHNQTVADDTKSELLLCSLRLALCGSLIRQFWWEDGFPPDCRVFPPGRQLLSSSRSTQCHLVVQ